MSNYYKDQMAWKTEIFISGPLQKVLTDPCSRKSTPLFFHLFTMGCLHLRVSLPKMTFPHLTSNIFCQSCSSHYLEEADPTPKQNKITFPVVLLYSFPHRPYHDGITLIIWVLIYLMFVFPYRLKIHTQKIVCFFFFNPESPVLNKVPVT